QAPARARRQNGQRDAGEIDEVGPLDRRGQRRLVVGEQLGRRGVAPIGEVAVALFLMDQIEPGPAIGDGQEMVGADIVLGEEGADIARITIFPQAGEIIHRPVSIEQCAHIPGGIERIAGIAQPVGAVFAPAHFDHAFADADNTLASQSYPPLLSGGYAGNGSRVASHYLPYKSGSFYAGPVPEPEFPMTRLSATLLERA